MNICRRVTALRGLGRITPTLQKTIGALKIHFYTDKCGAFWLSEEDSKDYEHYRPNSGRDISEIPTIELVNAIIETLSEQVSLREDDLSLLASKKMGFTRRGTIVEAAFTKAIEALKADGKIERIGDNIRIKEN